MHLGNPVFGNSFTLDSGARIKRTIDGALIVGTYGNQLESFSVSFVALDEQTRDAFIGFLQASAGMEIFLTDHEGFAWQGFITDQAPTLTHTGPGCHYTCAFNFEGYRLN